MAPLLNYDNMQHHPTRRLRQPQPVIAIFQIETFQPLTRTSCWKSFQITNRLLRLTEIDLQWREDSDTKTLLDLKRAHPN